MNEEKRVPALPVKAGLVATDRVLVVANATGNAQTALVTVSGLFHNTSGLYGHVLVAANTPANSTAVTTTAGSCWTDGNYLYVATSANHAKRVALSDF